MTWEKIQGMFYLSSFEVQAMALIAVVVIAIVVLTKRPAMRDRPKGDER